MPAAEALFAAVADAGPLIHLDEIDALRFLSGFEEVLVPSVVVAELSLHRPRWKATAPRSIRESDPSPRSVRALIEDGLAAGLDRGEVAALALWRERPEAILLCDDLAARRVAERIGLDEARALIHAIPKRTTLHVQADLLRRVLAELDDG